MFLFIVYIILHFNDFFIYLIQILLFCCFYRVFSCTHWYTLRWCFLCIHCVLCFFCLFFFVNVFFIFIFLRNFYKWKIHLKIKTNLFPPRHTWFVLYTHSHENINIKCWSPAYSYNRVWAFCAFNIVKMYTTFAQSTFVFSIICSRFTFFLESE